MTDDSAVLAQRQAIDAVHGGDPALIEMLFGPPLTVVADLLRGMICAPKGRQLYVADFAAIEARAVAWLAGQTDVLDVFRTGADIYKQQAGGIFGIPPATVDKDQRQIGKVAILALGYQGGVAAFQAMSKGYGLKIGAHYDAIWSAARTDHREAALRAWDERGKRSGIAERTWKAAEVVKVAWRAANPRIVALWRDLEDAAIAAVQQPGTTHAAGYIRFKKAGSFLWCQLPSGRVLCYPYPSLREVTTPWGAKRTQLVYRYTDQFTKQWTEGPTYGGSLAENCLGADTRVLTETGWKPILAITPRDRLWDGVEWVRHEGVIFSGLSDVVNYGGIQITPEHKVLTKDGWRHAENARYEDSASQSARFDGLRFWPADAGEPVRQPAWQDFLDCALCLWDQGRGSGVGDYAQAWLRGEVLRLCHGSDDRGEPSYPRSHAHEAVRGLAEHDRPVPSAVSSVVAQLRWARNHCLRALARLLGVSFGRRADVPTGTDAGPQGQQRRLHAGEFPLGQLRGAGEQQEGQRGHRHTERPDDRLSRGASVRDRSYDDFVPDQRRLAGGPAASAARLFQSSLIAVFDIRNAGPRHRFTVRGGDGRSVIVSNCTQAVARDIMAEAMQRVDTAGYEVILTVHDEVVSETATGFGSVDEFRKLMEVVPTWATGFPIAAEAWSGVRYRK